MREARLIFPMNVDSAGAINIAYNAIATTFGGWTGSTGLGNWRDPNGNFLFEVVRIVDVAYIPTPLNDAVLYDIAWKFRQDANQTEVYLRYGNGHVQMVTEFGCMNNGELAEKPDVSFDWETLRTELHRLPDDPDDVVEHAEHVLI